MNIWVKHIKFIIIIKTGNYTQILHMKNVKNRRKYEDLTKNVEKLLSKLYNNFIKKEEVFL